MQITQTVNPFSSTGASSGSSFLIFLVVIGILGGIGYYFYKKNKTDFQISWV